MVTLVLIHIATKFAHFVTGVSETWRETQHLRRTLAGPTEE